MCFDLQGCYNSILDLMAFGCKCGFSTLSIYMHVIPRIAEFKFYFSLISVFSYSQTFEDSDLFHLIGVVCGLAIYNFTIVDLHFPLALYKKLLNKKPSLEDLRDLMPDVGR